MNGFWKVLTLVILASMSLAVLTHAKGFSTAAGTLFTGVQGISGTLAGGSIKQGS